MFERLIEMTRPPAVGETYLVPVTDMGGALSFQVPVMGREHQDPEFNNNFDHMHIDPRFVTASDLKNLGLSFNGDEINNWYKPMAYALPSGFADGRQYGYAPWYKKAVRPIVTIEAPRECLRVLDLPPNWEADNNFHFDKFKSAFKVKGHKLDLNCRICPHKGAYLGSVAETDGYIKCPLHGLKFSASTGEVL